jgi:protein ImuA
MNIGFSAMLPAEPMEQHLSRLRRTIANVETFCEDAPSRALGVGAVDATLGGGLQGATLHEVSAAAPVHLGAAAGFALALAALANDPHRQTLWIATDFGNLETGALYGPGLDQFGLSTDRLLIAHVARPVDALFAMEEALKCRALATVVAEFADTPDLTATRRLALAAREGGGIALLLRHKSSNAPSVARTRWQIAAAPSVPDAFGGLGRTAFTLSLTRNRRGPCGNWTLIWDQHEHAFSALSVGVAATASDRPDRETLRTG